MKNTQESLPSVMKIHCPYNKLVSIDELEAHPKNRNKHPEDQVKRLAEILKYQGWRYPVKVSKLSGYVISGHGRIEAAKINGWDKAPVSFQNYESEEQEYADLQADNAIASWAELDFSGINSDIGELGPDFDIDMLGIRDFEIEVADKYEDKDEDAVPEHVEPKTKLGDLYRLGNHRLLCGDATMIDDVEKLMGGDKADMVFTDPPYGMSLDTDFSGMASKLFKGKTGCNYHDKIIGDDSEFNPTHLLDLSDEIILWGANYYAKSLPKGSWFVWDKRLSESADKMWGSEFELAWSKIPHKQSIARVKWAGIFGMETQDTKKRVHPTQKPVELCEWFFERIKAKSVIDLYGGSGSTLIACEKTNRKCFMMELDPHYCDVIVKRWEDYTDKKAELING